MCIVSLSICFQECHLQFFLLSGSAKSSLHYSHWHVFSLLLLLNPHKGLCCMYMKSLSKVYCYKLLPNEKLSFVGTKISFFFLLHSFFIFFLHSHLQFLYLPFSRFLKLHIQMSFQLTQNVAWQYLRSSFLLSQWLLLSWQLKLL